MAHSLSAQKRVRQALKRNGRNRARKELLKNDTKAFTAALAVGDPSKAVEAFNSVSSRLDKTAAKHTIHKNTAARRRSRMALKLNALKSGELKPVAPVKTGGAKKAKAGTKA